jgi:hypothetical protein
MSQINQLSLGLVAFKPFDFASGRLIEEQVIDMIGGFYLQGGQQNIWIGLILKRQGRDCN